MISPLSGTKNQTEAVAASTPARCLVSVVIKALNEESGIVATIESALRAVSKVGGEVVLADSCSTDRTVELAMKYPIRIVQLTNPSERCCGVGPQLGFQHSSGEFIYIIDGDMQLLDGFLEEALHVLAQRPDVAGVGGRVVELNTESLEYVSREQRAAVHRQSGNVDRLDGGGLYRRSAIEAAGYFSDRNLHSYEEYDLGVRLRSLGWKLWRVPDAAVNHFGHDAPPYLLLMRRWRSRYVCGLGELIRAAAGQPRLPMVLAGLTELRLYLLVLLWWLLLLSIPIWPLEAIERVVIFCLVLAFPVAVMTWRKRAFDQALYAVVSWCFHSAGLLRGLLQRPRPQRDAIASAVLREPSGICAPPARHGTLAASNVYLNREEVHHAK
jgi:glycosyltransferase involved in cell wall biosynthesis